MKKFVLFAFCVAFEHLAFALHDSAGWSWNGRSSKGVAGQNDEDLVDMLYRRESRANADHPTLEQRMEYRRTYEVTEEPERDWEGDGSSYVSNLDNHQDLPYPDNSIGPDAQPHSSSSSTFMSSNNGDSLYTAYSHKIFHNKK